MAKSALSLLLVAAALFTLALLVSAEEQQQNPVAKASELQQKSDQVQLRNVREADAKTGKRRSGKKSKKNRPKKKKGNKKKVNKKTRKNIKKKCQKGKKCRKGGKRIKKIKNRKNRKNKEKKTKRGQKTNSNSIARDSTLDCNNGASAAPIATNYKKFRNSMAQVRRLINSCGKLESKAKKGEEGIFSLAGKAICTKNEHPTLAEQLDNCTTTVKNVCNSTEVYENCNATAMALYKECNESLTAYQDGYNGCVGGDDNTFCNCVKQLGTVPDSKCLKFKNLERKVHKQKKGCVGDGIAGSFGSCRKLQQQAAEEANCPICTSGSSNTTAASNITSLTTSGSAGRRKILRQNLVKKWMNN